MKSKSQDILRFIDLFSGMGGIRIGFEQAAAELGYETECVFTSEIKPAAVTVFHQNHPEEKIDGDITQIEADAIPDFDYLLAGFPCQAFSAAGKRQGFADTRGTLFFDVERIISQKRPRGFILENVEGLVNHDKIDKNQPMGRTLSVILACLADTGYKVSWRVLNARNFGVPQDRSRIYIVGRLDSSPLLDDFPIVHATLKKVLEKGKTTRKSPFIDLLLSNFSVDELKGKSIKDKRGGEDNIHSWDIGYKGEVTDEQKKLLCQLLKERRKKCWAEEFGIKWMDGMPLTLYQISTFCPLPHLESLLEDLVDKGYLVKEHPKILVTEKMGEIEKTYREQDPSLPVGYNIVAGKLSFEVSKVLDPDDVAPTLVAMDMQKLFVADGDGLRNLTLREGLRLFGYPDCYCFAIPKKEAYDLLGNTVVVPVIKAVATQLLKENKS